jgi:hypothetical protein
MVIGEDPIQQPPSSAPTGGAFANGGTHATGGVFPTGGSFITGTGGAVNGGTSTGVFGGTTASGGAATGGAVNGGTTTSTGGQGGSSGSSITEGGEGSVDPYPRVSWDMGQGYRSACPRWGDTWGFTCWHFADEQESQSCTLDGSVYCNACSCAVPCETSNDCPPTLAGEEAACLAAPLNVPSCFVLCHPSTPKPCPDGTRCSRHPGTNEFVCIWVNEPGE